MHTFEEFCQHYEYDESSDEAKNLYEEYRANYQIFESMKA